MRMFQNFAGRSVAAGMLCLLIGGVAVGADGFGTIKGQFIYDGDVPKPTLQIKKGDATVKDAAVCAANDLLTNELLVDPETKGIANVFIYLRSIDEDEIHPDLVKSEKKELVMDQKNCRFYPHAMFVRTDQVVRVLSDDNCAHNTHTFPIRNNAVNFLMRPNDRVGQEVSNPVSEILPIQVKCDIHPWMRAYWLILDHPYAAVTDAKGNFTIENLPEGKHSFRVWHERVGYIDRTYKVEVEDGKVTMLEPEKVPASKFED